MKENSQKIKKTLKIFVVSLLAVVLIPIIVVTIILVVNTYRNPDHIADIFGISPVVVTENDSLTELERGDLIFIEDLAIEEIKVDDVVVYGVENTNGTKGYIGGLVSEVVEGEGSTYFRVKNASNESESEVLNYSNIEGKYFYKIAEVGNFIMWLQTPVGTIICVIFPVFFWIFYDKMRDFLVNIFKPKSKLEVTEDQKEV